MPNAKTIITIAAVAAGTFIVLDAVAIASGGRADWRRLSDALASPFLPSKPKTGAGITVDPSTDPAMAATETAGA